MTRCVSAERKLTRLRAYRSGARLRVDHRLSGRGGVPNFNHQSRCLLTRKRTKMDVNSSAGLPPATGIICLIDDDPSMLRALDRLLSSAGLQAQLFSEPLVFLSYVICNSVALAVIDIWMSGMSGLEVQKELQTRVIISTANDHDSVPNAAIQAGAIADFVKPFDDGAFLAAVHQAVASES